MWFTAFFPEPPIPMTMMRAKLCISSFIFGIIFIFWLIFHAVIRLWRNLYTDTLALRQKKVNRYTIWK